MTTTGSIQFDDKIIPTISTQVFSIAGIITVVHGLDELPKTCRSISCLWLLHPRLQTKETMAYVASKCIANWNLQPSSNELGLIAVSFDQRNHGTREVTPLANQTWAKGNERHATDMFSIFNGTTVDTTLLIDHLASYVFNKRDDPEINHHLVLGVSLGGHSAWQVVLNDERVTTAVVIIGCPDFERLMSNRARLSHRESAGPNFCGSMDFPRAIVNSVRKYDPRGIFFATGDVTVNPTEDQQRTFRDILDSKLNDKRILVCSGAEDKLVPYQCSEPFLKFLKDASNGWYSDGNIHLEDRIYPGIGHKFSDDMLKDSIEFLNDSLLGYIKKSAPLL